MSGWTDSNFEGNERKTTIDLSTARSSSSTALLSSIRAERRAREDKRRHEMAVLKIQKVWRGRREAKKVELDVLDRLERGLSWESGAGALVVILRRGWTCGDGPLVTRKRRALREWCASSLDRATGFWDQQVDVAEWAVKLGIITMGVLVALSQESLGEDTSVFLSALVRVTSQETWSGSGQEAVQARQYFVDYIAKEGWVKHLVSSLEQLVTASLPKKKNPLIVPWTTALVAPFSLASAPVIMLEQMLHTLLAVPALPSLLPIASLTRLSAALPLFTSLLPVAVARPELLNQGRLATEIGKTNFLANLVTFGVTGGMLTRFGLQGAQTWISVVGSTLRGVEEGWGKWIDGQQLPPQEDEPMPMQRSDDSDDEANENIAGPSRLVSTPVSRPRRPPLPPNVQKKVVVLASPAHLGVLTDTLLTPSAPSDVLIKFSSFALSLLDAFRGSPRWEGILEAFLSGAKGKALEKRIWREGVRGKWSNSGDRSGWDHFSENPSTPCLLFLTHLYNHYLLITPDDEFFNSADRFFNSADSNPFSLDEVLELAGIWRDLSYYAYTNGVAPAGTKPLKGIGTEDERALLTKGVTRVSERNARRRFADEDFWVMVHSDMRSFIDVAVLEDAELTGNANEEEEQPANELPRWARARQKFSKRQLAYISPRLGLLNNLPMAVPFLTRLEIFRNFIENDRNRVYGHSQSGRIKAKIRRDHLVQDGFDALSGLGPALKGNIYIKFYNKFGEREAGIDGGGLFKEFLTSLSKEVFDTNRGLWLFTEERQLYPNPHSYATEPYQLQWYAFIGNILGKALYEGILVDISFADFFLAKWLGRQSYLDDLQSLDKDLYKGLIVLKNYPTPEDLALNFTLTEEEFGVTKTIELIPNGADVPVNAYNRHEYIQLVCRHKLDRQIAQQSRAFFSGLSDIIDSKWLRMFDQRELRQLIGGEDTLIDIDDLKANCEISGFPDDSTMRMFWKVVRGFSQEERKALLRFVTSCSRPPLLGFAYLYPKFGVRWSGGDATRLPSASACFNLLKMPAYPDEASLRAKLLQAITSESGFDLS